MKTRTRRQAAPSRLQRSTCPGVLPTRRGVLKGGLAGAAALGLAQTRPWSQPAGAAFDKELFLLDRITFGYNADMAQEMSTRGYTGFLEWQLDHLSIDDSAAEAAIAQDNQDLADLFGYSPFDVAVNFPYPGYYVQGLCAIGPVFRGYHSRRQLFHVMCDFWQNVHNTFVRDEFAYLWWQHFQETVACQHALGSYPELVKESAKGASMLFYLNQWLSEANDPIENYARELMELHTLGIAPDGSQVYDETDVVQAARIFTGWTFEPLGTGSGTFFFDPMKHASGTKTVLGVDYPENGQQEGLDLIDDLTHHDSTASHIAYRLIRWFLMDNPRPLLVQRVADAYTGSNGDIKETLRELFNEEFIDEIRPRPNLKYRRPMNLVTAFLRVCQPTVEGSYGWLVNQGKAGQLSGFKPSPDGYPGENGVWEQNLQPRLEFIEEATHNLDNSGLEIQDKLADLFPGTPSGEHAQQANLVVTGGRLPAAEVARIQQYLDDLESAYPGVYDLRREALSLTFSSPSYQYLY